MLNKLANFVFRNLQADAMAKFDDNPLTLVDNLRVISVAEKKQIVIVEYRKIYFNITSFCVTLSD